MRIVSLVPHATELLFALGLGDQVVGVTHECDHPTAALARPHVTRDMLPPGLSSAGIDAAVREHTEKGGSIYGLDSERLRELAPDLIVTQNLCAVCAVSADDVRAIAGELPSHPKVVSLDPTTLGETMADVRTIAPATGARGAAGRGLGGGGGARRAAAGGGGGGGGRGGGGGPRAGKGRGAGVVRPRVR